MSTFKQIATTVAASNTTLYTATAKTKVVSLDFCNTTNADLTISIFWEDVAGSTTRYLAKTATVPALGNLSWRGVVVLETSEKIRAIASAVGIDVLGAVLE